jgi:DNA-binding beta-propeller fold protein YncE
MRSPSDVCVHASDPAPANEAQLSDTLAALGQPLLWRTVDQTGTVFLADADYNLIRKIDPSGEMTILAGNGEPGFADGKGATAQFAYPAGLTVDNHGNVYLADTGNHRIRKIDPTGVVSTLAGNGQPGFADGEPDAAQFQFPLGVANDGAGNVYVTDRSNRRVRKIDVNGIVSTLAGTGIMGHADGPGAVAQFQSPAGIMIDQAGTLYVSDLRDQRIRTIDPKGIVSTLAESN